MASTTDAYMNDIVHSSDDENEELPQEQLSLKIKKRVLDKVNWTDEMELILLNQVIKYKVNEKSAKISQASKWTVVKGKLLEFPQLDGVSSGCHFRRMLEAQAPEHQMVR